MVIKGSSIPKMRGTRCALAQTGLWYLTTAGVSLMACSSARALPAIADAVKGDIAILADSGIRNGLDVA
jgi:L-lactate dehydrogenase (cytochrome)